MSAAMEVMQDLWQQWSRRFVALSRRERGILVVALMLGGGFIVFSVAVKPHLLQAQAANKVSATARSELSRQLAQLAVLNAQNADPDARSRQRLSQAQDRRKLLGARLAAFEAGMVSPSRMRAFLEGLLSSNRNIELLELKTLAVEQVGAALMESKAETPLAQVARIAGDTAKALAAAKGVPASAGAEGIYQHGVEIRLAGGYNDLLNYLAELEHLPQQVMWNSIRLEVIKYPRNEMTLRVYTLSLDKNWLVL